MRVLGGNVRSLWGCQTPAQYWIKIAHPWVQKFYPVLGLGSGERLLWHFQTPVLYWIISVRIYWQWLPFSSSNLCGRWIARITFVGGRCVCHLERCRHIGVKQDMKHGPVLNNLTSGLHGHLHVSGTRAEAWGAECWSWGGTTSNWPSCNQPKTTSPKMSSWCIVWLFSGQMEFVSNGCNLFLTIESFLLRVELFCLQLFVGAF